MHSRQLFRRAERGGACAYAVTSFCWPGAKKTCSRAATSSRKPSRMASTVRASAGIHAGGLGFAQGAGGGVLRLVEPDAFANDRREAPLLREREADLGVRCAEGFLLDLGELP